MRRLEKLNSQRIDESSRYAQLVARVLEGDTEAFRPLVEEFEPAVFGLCRKLLGGNEAEAEDVSQETFIQAFRYLPTLEDRERFAPWLYQIARSLCRTRLRSRAVERRALAERAEALRRSNSYRQSGVWQDDTDHVTNALAELPAPEQEALSMRYFEGLSYDEIAKRLQTSFHRVDHLIRKARARLARRIEVRRQRAKIL